MAYKYKKIIGGKTYNTETATVVFEKRFENDWVDAGIVLFQTRHGAFFLLKLQDCEEPDFCPLTDEEAQELLERYCATDTLEQYFGPFPEAGAAEARLTIRIPGNLAARVEAVAKAKNTSVNSYAMRCFERCVAEDGRPAGRE